MGHSELGRMVSQRRVVGSPDVVDDAERRLPRTDTAHRLPEAGHLSGASAALAVMVVVMMRSVTTSRRNRRPPTRSGFDVMDVLEVGVVRRWRRGVVLVAPQVACYSRTTRLFVTKATKQLKFSIDAMIGPTIATCPQRARQCD